MSAVLTGTPVAWTSGAVTIPADATAVYVLWSYKSDSDGHGLASATLGGVSPSQTHEIPTSGSGSISASGVVAWYSPTTGSQTLSITWDGGIFEGPDVIVVFVKDGDTTAWRDADSGQASGTTAVSATLTTVAGDLVLKLDAKYGATPPSLSSGWTSGQTQTQVDRSARASYISAAGTTQVCDCEDEGNSTLVAIAIPTGGPPPQELYPSSDHTDGAWTPSTGTDNYAVLDDTTDTEYSSTNSNSALRVNMQTGSTPDTGTRTLSVRAFGSPEKKLIVRLIEGSTTVQTFTHDPVATSITQYDETVTNSISNYADLDVECEIADATSPPTLAVTWGATGTAASGTTSCAPSYPTGISAATSKIFCMVTGRSNTANTAPTMPAGWTSIGALEGGTGTWGIDTGTRRVELFQKDTVTGSESGTVTVSLSGTTVNTLRASIFRVEVPALYGIDVSVGTGADTTNGTAYSATSSSNLGFQANDLLLLGTAQNIDTGTATSRAISAAGITFGTLTNRADTAVTNGNDHRHIINSVPVSSGSGTVAPTYSYTISASGSGPTLFARMRAVVPTEKGRVTSIKFTIPAAASGGVTGTFAQAIAASTLAASGTTTIVGALAQTTAAATLAAAGSPIVTGTLAQSTAAATLAASGSAGASVSGTLAQTTAAATLAAAGSPVVPGTLAQTTAAATLAAAGSPIVPGTLAQTTAAATLAAAGTTTVRGTMAQTTAAATLAAAGSVGSAVSGTLAQTTAAATLAAAGSPIVPGALAQTTAAATLAASGSPVVMGSVATTTDAATLAAAGSPIVVGALAATLDAATLDAYDAGAVPRAADDHTVIGAARLRTLAPTDRARIAADAGRLRQLAAAARRRSASAVRLRTQPGSLQ